MANDPKAKPKTPSKWANPAPIRSASTDFEQRRKLWEALTAYITSNGGWVTGLPGTKHLRVEVPRDSALPAKLMEFGYSLRHCGTGTRITPKGGTETITKYSSTRKPIIRRYAGIVPVDIIEVELPGPF